MGRLSLLCHRDLGWAGQPPEPDRFVEALQPMVRGMAIAWAVRTGPLPSSFDRASSVQSSTTPWELGNENQQQRDNFVSKVFIIF